MENIHFHVIHLPMNILIAIHKYFPFGGLQCDMLRFAQHAADRNHQVTIATTQWDAPKPSKNISVTIIPKRGFANHTKLKNFASDVQKLIPNFDTTITFVRLPGFDWYFSGDDCYATLFPLKHSKLLLKFHPRYKTFLNLEEQIFNPDSKTSIFIVAPHQQQDFINAYNTQPQRFHLLPPGMNPNCIRPYENSAQVRRNNARRQLGIPQDAVVSITVGANLKLKGADRVIQAINTINQERAASKIHHLLVGKLPADLQQLAAQSKEIHALGLRQDIPDLLLAADIMLHPARQEAAGSVLIEAIASGIPVICSDVCGFKDHVLSTSNLVTSEPFNQEQFVQLTRTALDNLPKLTQTTRDYAAKNDFNARSDQMLQLMAGEQ